jgi:omega-6 fatty acid desaturase (delta-12 desaturase)
MEKIDWKPLLKKYHYTSNKRAALEICNSFGPYFLTWYLAFQAMKISYWYALPLIIINAGFIMRIFSIQHDCGHNTFVKSKRTRSIIGFICGVITITAYQSWRKIHAVHHNEAGNLTNRGINDLSVLTTDEYKVLNKKQKFNYKAMRHPLMILGLIPFFLFFILQRIPSFGVKDFTNAEKMSVHYTNFCILSLFLIIGHFTGYLNFLLIMVPANLIASTIGTWVFYTHHQFEQTYWSKQESLDPYLVAMKGSCYIALPGIFQWFIGNTGYHHIHHLTPYIPSYNIARCYKENPILHQVSKISFLKSFEAFKLNLWDEEQQKLVKILD